MGKNSLNAQLSAKDIVDIIKQGRKNNLKSLSIGDLSISYHDNLPQPNVPKVKEVPVQIKDKLEEKVSEEVIEELNEYVEDLNVENLDLENPGAYEEMIFDRTKTQKQDTPDA